MKVTEVRERCQGVLDALSQIVVGKDRVLRQIMAGLLADGHILIEDYPGLAKTLIARLFSQALELRFMSGYCRSNIQTHAKPGGRDPQHRELCVPGAAQ